MKLAEIQKVVREVMDEEPDAAKIKSVSLFGSYLHGDNRPDSDVDLLFEMRKTMSLFEIGGIQYRLQEKLGRPVDLVEKDSVIPQLKDEIYSNAKKIYERT